MLSRLVRFRSATQSVSNLLLSFLFLLSSNVQKDKYQYLIFVLNIYVHNSFYSTKNHIAKQAHLPHDQVFNKKKYHIILLANIQIKKII